MLHQPKSVFYTVAIFLSILAGCGKDTERADCNCSHKGGEVLAGKVKVKLINNDCIGNILVILDPRYVHCGQAGYKNRDGQVYGGAVWVQHSTADWEQLTVEQEYYVDLQFCVPRILAPLCYRLPGPPDKMVSVLKLYAN